MNEGIRFDLAYETMPWHKVDAVIFDIGNVLIRFAPDDFLQQLFPGDEQKQAHMLRNVYKGPYWLEFDRGAMTYEQAAERLAREAGGTYEEYMHALVGCIGLKTPLEEGWRAARRPAAFPETDARPAHSAVRRARRFPARPASLRPPASLCPAD